MRTASRADFGKDEAPISGGSGSDEIFDEEARQDFNTRLAEIEEAIATARESDSITRLDVIEELEKEKKWIASELRKSQGLKGRNRRLVDDRNRVRTRVCNAIRRALQQIREFDARLCEHLKKPVLNLGHTVSYIPRDTVCWSDAPPER
jgi:hypothetical protein